MKQKHKTNTLYKKNNVQAIKQTNQKDIQITQFSWSKFYIKLLLFFVIIVSVVIFTDIKGYFKSDQTNNHVDRKWKSFYQFTKSKNIDILLCGNSHIMTGIDPFVLSVATGTNCFILGTPGTSVRDAYFGLAEALTKTNPRLVILETYCIGDTKIYDEIMAQIQSFEAKENILYKLRMMPELFKSDDWIKAWSPTIRNHSFLLTNIKQIEFNIKNSTNRNISKGLDLGRFARFGTGLEDSTIMKYETLGAPNNGDEYEISYYSKKYLEKFVNLCKSRNIPVLFITVPVYYKHIANYDVMKAKLKEELKKYQSVQWLDLQSPYDSVYYTKDAFENTYERNQHLSNYGMTVTAYKLADFLLRSSYTLPNRSQESEWIADFQSQPHFIFNQNLTPNMSGYKSILKNKTVSNFQVNELLLRANNSSNTLMIKIMNNEKLASSVTGIFKVRYENQIISVPVVMNSTKEVMPPKHKIYFAELLKNVEILDINSIQ
ncbi:MAG: hypothetical protein LBQ28_02300 [Prevotellaceae bacterium]|jgi:hypothetical protein|nr:hypothetical protein [Prevotellaceae bacterium]